MNKNLNNIIPELPVASNNLDQNQYNLLQIILGDKKCTNTYINKSVNYIAFALIATLIFIILNIPWVDNCLAQLIPNCFSRFLFKAIIFFLLIYLLDRIICNWRAEQSYCE